MRAKAKWGAHCEIRQDEAAECGLACLASVAAFHGHRLNMRELRNRFPVSLKGVGLSRLMEIAGSLGLGARPLKVDLEGLAHLKVPCILHWDLAHFVVLVQVKKGLAVLWNPASGMRTLGLAEVSSHFTGVALELTPGAQFVRKAGGASLRIRRLIGQVQGVPQALFSVFGLSLALQVFVIASPFMLQWVVDQVLVSGDLGLLSMLAIGFALLLLLQTAVGLLRGWVVVYLSNKLGAEWQVGLFSHLMRLPLDFFEKRHLGDVVSRMGSLQSIQNTLTTTFIEAVIDGLMTVATLAMMAIYSWKLTVVTLVAVACYIFLRAMSYRALRDGTERQLIAVARQQGYLLESIRGIQSIKVATREYVRQAGYSNLTNDAVNTNVWLAKLGMAFNATSQLIFGIERVVVIWVGATLALGGMFSVGMLIAYLAYKDQFAQRMGALIDKWMELRMLRLHADRVADVALAEPEQGQGTAAMPEEPMGQIEVRDVWFRYADGEPWVLKNCSFTVNCGKSMAIVGASGCGKTTLVKVMLGLLRPQKGSVHFDGVDIERLGVSAYRNLVGAVMQDDQLFSGSIGENIAFGGDGYDPRRVQVAAALASVHEEITSMPMGYHSLIGDMGMTLSGGQKQRVILARALYRNPKVLFLDEATSHLDVAREHAVNEAIKGLMLTKVIIAHRPDTIASADEVLMMEGGRARPIAAGVSDTPPEAMSMA